MNVLLRLILALVIILAIHSSALGQPAAAPIPPPAWPVTSAPARYLIVSDEDKTPPSLAWVDICFPVPQWAAMPIRVFTDAGIAVGSEVLWTAPGEPTILLFDSSSGARQYHVYVGSHWPALPIPNTKAGVWIETRLGDGKPINRLADMLQAWNQSRTILGRAIDTGIREGGNRFGPQDNLFEHFQGWFDLAAPAHLEFGTISVDASFVLVDGKEVVEAPGLHNWMWPASGPPQGAIDLAAGPHTVDYYSAYVLPGVDNEPRVCSLAVKGGPLDQWTMLMPGNGFLRPVAHFHVLGYDLQGTSVGTSMNLPVPVFSVEWTSPKESTIYPDLPDIGLIEMQMFCRTPLAGTFTWTFDDGSTAQGQGVSHLFPRPGLRTVHVSLNNGDKELAWLNQTISVHPDWLHPEKGPQLHPEHEADIMGRNPDSLSASDLVSCFALFANYLKQDDLLKLLPAVCAKMKEMKDADLPYLKDAALYLTHEDWAHATEQIQLLQSLVDRSASAQQTPQMIAVNGECRVALARLILKTSDHTDEVRSLIEAIQVSTLPPKESRGLAILRADLSLATGDVEGARKQYQSLTGKPSDLDVRSSIRLTARLGEARAFLDRKDFDAAEDVLNQIARETPIEKISPDWALIRLRLDQDENLPVVAYLWAKRLLPVITESGRSELLFRLTDLAFAQGDTALAQKTLRELLEKHPYSEEAAQAKEKWPAHQ